MRRIYSNCLFFDRYRDFWICFYSVLCMFLIVVLIFISVFLKFNFSVSYSGIVSEEEYYVLVYISDNGLQNIKENVLVVDKVSLDYDIVRISDEYVLSDNGPVRAVYFKFNLSDNDKIVNNVVKLNFVYKNTIFNYLKERFL